MLPSIKELREAAGGLSNLTDEEIIGATFPSYQQYYGSVDDFAKAVGYGGAGRGLAGSRISAGIDNYQANMYGLGGAVARKTGLDGVASWMDRGRDRNEQSAQYAQERARDLGGIEDWREVDGFRSGANFVGGLAAQSLPYLGEAVAGGLAARGLMTGTRAALRGATTAEEVTAAGRRLGAGQTAGAVGASYPSAVGDILSAQRDSGGEDLGSAAMGGVPYAALNALGVEGLVARGFRPLATGQGGLTRRVATGAGVTALGEGISETGQELVNQSFGRMAVDPNETLFNEEANRRYLDSFVGGAALGGVFGGAGGIRRPRTVDDGQFDLTGSGNEPSTPQFSPLAPAIDTDLEVGLGITQPINMYDLGGQVSRFQEGGDTAIEGGQGGLFGDSLDERYGIGQPAQQQQLAAQQQQQETQARLQATAQVLGVTPVATIDNAFDVLGARVYGQSQVSKLVQEVDAINQQLSPEQQQLSAAILGANLVNLGGSTALPTAKKIANAVNGKLKQLQLEGVESVERAAEILNDQVATLVAAGKNEGDVKLGQIATVYERLTGQTPPALGGTTTAAPATTPPVAQTQQPRFQRAPAPQGQTNVSQAATPAGAPAPSVDGRSPVVPGSVGDTGRNAAVDQGVGGDAGNPGAAAQQAALLPDADVQQPAAVAEDANPVDALLARHFDGDARKSQIAKAYLSALKLAPKGSKGQVVQAIAKQFGIKPVTVRKYGNTTELRATAASMGLSPEQIEALDLPDNTKAAPVAKVTLGARVREDGVTELPYMGPGRNADRNVTRDPAKTQAMAAAGFETAEDVESSGFGGMDESNTWKQGREGMGDTGNSRDEAKANEIASLMEQQDALRNLIEEYEQEGQTDLIEGVQAQSETLQSKLEAALKSYEDYLKGKAKTTSAKVTKDQKPAKGKKAEAAPAVDEDTAPMSERAADAWNEVADSMGSAFPQFQDLSAADQETFTEFGPGNWTRQDVIKFAQDTGGDFVSAQFGKNTDGIKDAKAKNPYTAKELLAELKDFIRADIPGRKLLVVDSIEDLLRSPDKMVRAVGAAIALEGAYGVAANGRGYLIANRIQKGAGRAKFMHEVGAHLGLEKLLPKAEYDKLTQQIVNWAKKDDGSTESELALNAVERVQSAGTKQEDRRSELLAYFIEEAMEAGIDPTADVKSSGPLRDWFRSLWAAFKTAVRKLGFKPESMTAQDVVNLAFGAARLEINGTWHGTAASFRKFSNEFMGTGEGAQAYGWGTYLAQRTGIAKGYWSADVARKSGGSLDMPSYKVGDKTYTYSDGASEQSQIEYFAAEWLFSGKSADELARVLKLEGNPMGKASIELARKWKIEGKTATQPKATGPEGNLMRIDTAVTADETLDWDRPLSEQPAILEKLGMLMPQGLQEALAAQYEQNVEDIGELSGEDLYRGLRFLEKSEGLVSEFWGTDEYVGQPGKKVASLFLDSMGIKGIQFLDAKSRGASGDVEVDGKSLWGTVNGDAWAALVDSKGDIDAAIAELKKQESGFNPVFADNATEGIQQIEALRGQDIQYKAKVRTRNLVVFDDKNIFRVGSEAAADPQRMKFGKNASSVPSGVKPQVNTLTRALRSAADAALNKVIFSEDLFKRAATMGLNAAREMDRIYRERAALTGNIEREVTRIENMFNRIPKSARGTGEKSANRFLYDSTRENKWGFTPTWRGADASKAKVDPAMAARYNALPKEAQAWVSAVLEHGDKMLKLKKDTLIASTNSEYDALIADAKQRGETNKVTRLEKDKAASLKQFQRLFSTSEFNPYAPMRRFGDFVVIGKSKAYLDATPAERAKMESDPDQYHVSFAESRASALELQRQLEDQGSFSEVSTRAKEDARGDMYGGLMDAFNKLRGNIESELNNATEPKEIAALRAARETVAELYLASLAENSSRKSEMRRRGVAGEIDMLRSFGTQGRADAHFLASAKYNPQTQEAVVKMRQQVKDGGNQLKKSEAFKEIMARHTQSMRYDDGGWFDAANNASRVTSIWFLATNPMYYFQNLTQPFVLSLPFMTGKHDWSDAAGQLMRSYFQLGDLLKSAKLGEGFDFTKVSKDKNEQDMILKLVDRGRIDIGMDTELGKVKLDGDSAAGRTFNRTDRLLRSASQKVEAVNRVSTALAAYRLERKAGRSHEAALEYADEVIGQTHGDYTRINAPRAFNSPMGKVALQFRKFQLIQLTLLTKLVYNSFKGATAVEKATARKILTYTLAHTGVLAGVVGMPGFAAAAFIANRLVDLFGDDDEPYNLENEMRKLLGGGEIAQVLMRGAPNLVGSDLSGKLGMGTAMSILPFTDFEANREGFNAIAVGLTLGATGGLGARTFDALGDIKKGDYYRGLMGLAPIGFSQAIKAVVEADRGETNRRGDVLVSADEIATWESFAQAVGWPTTSVTERRFDRGVAFDNREAFDSRASKIKNEYTRAVRGSDSEARRKAIEKWQRLQNSRREAGFKPQPLSTLMRAPQEQAKRERNTTGGLQFNTQNRQFVQEQTAN